MMPDEMEAEKNRKIIVAQADEIEILKNNVRDLQEQLTAAHIKNKKLIEQNAEAMVMIGNLQQARDNAYDDISNLIKEDLECR